MLQFEETIQKLDDRADMTLAWLASELNLTRSRLNFLLSNYPSLSEAVEDNFRRLRQGPKTDWLQKFEFASWQDRFSTFQEKIEQHKLKITSWMYPEYPEKLKILPEPPLVLYYQGDWSAINESQLLTVVGSRAPSLYSKKLINQILAPVCQLGVGVASGLAYGIDALAHQTAVDKQTVSIGVIGSGLDLDSFYPRDNWQLKEQMLAEGGLVISEHPPGTPPHNYHFPRRNRLLAALSELTWVVQASLKSGSLITATTAQDLGKNVATTPSSIFEDEFAGNLKLLKEGASYVTEPEDILQILGLTTHPEINYQREPQFNSQEEKMVWQNLSLQPQLVESLGVKTRLDIQKLSSVLTMLELQNLAICTGENLWIRG